MLGKAGAAPHCRRLFRFRTSRGRRVRRRRPRPAEAALAAGPSRHTPGGTCDLPPTRPRQRRARYRVVGGMVGARNGRRPYRAVPLLWGPPAACAPYPGHGKPSHQTCRGRRGGATAATRPGAPPQSSVLSHPHAAMALCLGHHRSPPQRGAAAPRPAFPHSGARRRNGHGFEHRCRPCASTPPSPPGYPFPVGTGSGGPPGRHAKHSWHELLPTASIPPPPLALTTLSCHRAVLTLGGCGGSPRPAALLCLVRGGKTGGGSRPCPRPRPRPRAARRERTRARTMARQYNVCTFGYVIPMDGQHPHGTYWHVHGMYTLRF